VQQNATVGMLPLNVFTKYDTLARSTRTPILGPIWSRDPSSSNAADPRQYLVKGRRQLKSGGPRKPCLASIHSAPRARTN
jgi:hypothetical protein